MRGITSVDKIKIILTAICATVALAACSASMSINKQFDESIAKYNKFLGSQNFDAAAAFTLERLSSEFRARAREAKNIKIVDYRIKSTKTDFEKGEAEVEVEIDYFSFSAYIVKTLVDVQKWSYVTENGVQQWKLTSLLPEFK